MRTKFICSSITTYSNYAGRKVCLEPAFKREDEKFWKNIPLGKMDLNVEGELKDYFEIGKEYHVDFWLAE